MPAAGTTALWAVLEMTSSTAAPALTSCKADQVTFSKLRPVFHQARWSSMRLLAPPYGKLANRLLAFLTR